MYCDDQIGSCRRCAIAEKVDSLAACDIMKTLSKIPLISTSGVKPVWCLEADNPTCTHTRTHAPLPHSPPPPTTDNISHQLQPPCQVNTFTIPDQLHIANSEENVWSRREFYDSFLATAHHRASMPVVTAEVSSVPCKAHVCCNMLFSFRPNTTDRMVFTNVSRVLGRDTHRCSLHRVTHKHVPNTSQIYIGRMFTSVFEHLNEETIQYILVCHMRFVSMEDPYPPPHTHKQQDAGGNVGYSAVLFALRYPNAKIVSIEPDIHNYHMALMNTARFPNIHVVHAGLWSTSTQLGALGAGKNGVCVIVVFYGKTCAVCLHA